MFVFNGARYVLDPASEIRSPVVHVALVCRRKLVQYIVNNNKFFVCTSTLTRKCPNTTNNDNAQYVNAHLISSY